MIEYELMKVIVISDTHSQHAQIQLPAGDLLIHAGDITSIGKEKEVKDFLNWFESQPHPNKIFIAGNHDFYLEQTDASVIKKIIPPGVVYLKDKGTIVEGLSIWGSPYTPWFNNWAFSKQPGRQINTHWKKIPEGTDILITHGPPFQILDELASGILAGCPELNKRILEIRPKYHLFGHIHEGYGKKRRMGTTHVNASVLNQYYLVQNKPISFNI